jgi:hypothetical protein
LSYKDFGDEIQSIEGVMLRGRMSMILDEKGIYDRD